MLAAIIVLDTLAAPILIFDLEGFELPSSASEELKNPRRDVPFAVLCSGIGTVLFYGVPILAILPSTSAPRSAW
jgi:amino acid transporter